MCKARGVERYPEPDSKLALAIKSTMVAKEEAVREHGLGEDLTFALWGWSGDQLRAIGALSQEKMLEPHQERANRIAMGATVFRQGWGVDAFIFVAEGFVSLDATKTAGRPLREVFIEPGSPVSECLTFTYVDAAGYDIVTQPYQVGLGRQVTWFPLLRSDNTTLFRDSLYPKILQLALRLNYEPAPVDEFTYYSILESGLSGDGFSVQWDFD